MRKKFLTALVVAGATLAGCGGSDVAIPEVTPDTATHVAMSQDRFTQIQTKIFESLVAADSAKDANALAARTTGPMTVLRTAQYATKAILADSYGIAPLSTTATGTAISSSSGTQRLAMSLMAPVQGANLQTIDVFAQTSARENWKLWGNLTILPGATVPGVTSGDAGATTIEPASGEGLVASPEAAMAAYVQLNQTRSDANGLSFSEDALRKQIAATQDSNATAVNGVGAASTTFGVAANAPVAFRTEDGGALVFGQMAFNTSIQVNKGRKVNVSTTQGKIAAGSASGVTTLDGQTLLSENTVIVAMYVPAAGAADQTIKVVAASEIGIVRVSVG